ncbi:MAG: inorganic phosphate transporter [Polyangiaceae bacterium]
MSILLVSVILVALFFDFTNGFHDAANAIGTSISTRALSPRSALLLAALLNFIGALLSTNIAATVCKGIVIPEVVTLEMVLAGLIAAITWNLITWYYGIPSSSSHCLVGGIAGAVLIGFGHAGVQWMGIVGKVLVPTVRVAHPRIRRRPRFQRGHLVDDRRGPTGKSRHTVSPSSDHLRKRNGAISWAERRAEDHGDHYFGALRRPRDSFS